MLVDDGCPELATGLGPAALSTGSGTSVRRRDFVLGIRQVLWLTQEICRAGTGIRICAASVRGRRSLSYTDVLS